MGRARRRSTGLVVVVIFPADQVDLVAAIAEGCQTNAQRLLEETSLLRLVLESGALTGENRARTGTDTREALMNGVHMKSTHAHTPTHS